eukprot:CAMPEP_0204825342 /NCGR_PEP_ID=MMETSP1346-20131115/3245_1 /ASSEMBLY_ACC=CAM_ASM_000771 /TAXON_ID=215587 /ORGANISM="Aplanochytrium stocchinoi, Strain GSBS06" /LENGTH=465 /DNA_ID=CAMNT_0051952941 /DNA_START=262 /DNA_END=1659 /DNA_ORIENTATION=+
MEAHFGPLAAQLGADIENVRKAFREGAFARFKVKEIKTMIRYFRRLETSKARKKYLVLTGYSKMELSVSLFKYGQELERSSSRPSSRPNSKPHKRRRNKYQINERASGSSSTCSRQPVAALSSMSASTSNCSHDHNHSHSHSSHQPFLAPMSNASHGYNHNHSRSIPKSLVTLVPNWVHDQNHNRSRAETETKEEPVSWSELSPIRPEEEPNLGALLTYGFSQEISLKALRAHGNNIQCALGFLVQNGPDSRMLDSLIQNGSVINDTQFTDYRLMDEVALESETTHNIECVRRREEEEIVLAQGDVIAAGLFNSCVLLQCQSIKDAVDFEAALLKGSFIDPVLRKKCIELLGLEKKATKWYGIVARNYFSSLRNEIEDMVRSGGDVLTVSSVANKVEHIQKVVFSYPNNSGGVPLEFAECKNHSSSSSSTSEYKNCDNDDEVMIISQAEIKNGPLTKSQPVIEIL